MLANNLPTIGLLGLLTLCMIPTQMIADASASTPQAVMSKDPEFSSAHQTILISLGIVLTYLACSEKVQFVATKAALRGIIASLQQLLKLPFSDAMKQKIQTKIDYLEIVNSKRKAPRESPEIPESPYKSF